MPARTLEVLDAEAVRRWLVAAHEALAEARDEIDDLNVYPVPDGDTGTNLLLTMESVVQAVEGAVGDGGGKASLSDVVEAMARGALMGARGNSGVILSQLLRGLADALSEPAAPGSAAHVQRGLTRAAELAYAAVATPVEGTLLTVARECAEAAAAVRSGGLAAVVEEAHRAATASLARTPDLLPQLEAAGVVDAGGRGLCVLLGALERVVTGAEAPTSAPQLLVPRDRSGLARARESGSDEYAYEVQYLLTGADEAAVESLKVTLSGLGDSLVVVGADDLYNVHVHVNDVGGAVEAGVEAGRPSRITVTRFADQAGEGVDGLPVMNERPAARSVVAVAPGAGLSSLFETSGALVVQGGPTSNPSTGELLDAVRRSGGAEVVLLPNDGNTIAVASAAGRAARDEGVSVAVVPTRSVLQGLAALAVADPERSFADDVASMAEAAGSTRWAEVTTAVRESMTMAGVCRPGDVLGLIEGDVVLIGDDVEKVAVELLDRMLDGGGELVTVVTGQDAPDGAADRLVEHVERSRPAVEAVAYQGGQPHYPLLLGVE
ncbi:MAG TPA: DAK2 domain-containing protein [Mycobacteriales bacterium]|nr:DAK2 domain-containing protein [Mycobacteriales bacterium]